MVFVAISAGVICYTLAIAQPIDDTFHRWVWEEREGSGRRREGKGRNMQLNMEEKGRGKEDSYLLEGLKKKKSVLLLPQHSLLAMGGMLVAGVLPTVKVSPFQNPGSTHPVTREHFFRIIIGVQ